MRKIIIVLATASVLLSVSVSAGAESLLINGDVNADQKVDLRDVIFVLNLITGEEEGSVSPGADIDGDGIISLQEALYQLQTIVAAYAYLQPFIDEYSTNIVTENTLADARLKELEKTFYFNSDTGPALKMPTIEFKYEGFDFSVDMGSYNPPEATPEPIDSVRLLLYDSVYEEWVYGLNQNTQTSFLTENSHGDDFSATYFLPIDGTRRIFDNTVKDLNDIDPARGILLHVITEAGSEFLVGGGNTLRISTAISAQRTASDETRRIPSGTDDIQEKAAQVETLPVVAGDCPCPNVDMLAELQKSFAKQGIPLTADHLNIKESQPVFACGDDFKAIIRLGSDLEVLESPEKLGQRIRDNDFRRVEPAGYFRGAHYLLILNFWSWWSPNNAACICQFSWELIDVRTARILGAGFVEKECGNLVTDFDSMIGEIETLGELFMLSDSDYDIPYCDDGNPCTWDAYDLKTRECKHRAKASLTPCDDGDPCTLDDKCINGKCVRETKVCNDNNPCTEDSCDPETGECRSVRLADGTPCDDGDPVTENDVCMEGYCDGTINFPIPNVPRAIGQPSFSPDPVNLYSTTIVSVPITTDTQKVAIQLWDTERPFYFAMTYKDNLAGQNLAEIETPWISVNIYEDVAMVYMEFDVYAGNYGGAYSRYTYDPSRSETYYIVYQNDLLGHTVEKVSDIPIAWLTVQLQ